MLEKTNEKKSKKSTSLFSRFTSKKRKSMSSTEKQNKNVKKIAKCITLSPEEMKKELDSIVKNNKHSQIVEYYDLPYRYNQTVIKILAQTPHSIFIYWDISDADRNAMEQKYGDVIDPLRFLREREIVHFQRFGEALRGVQDKLAEKKWYMNKDC